jgi:hypothetical protein
VGTLVVALVGDSLSLASLENCQGESRPYGTSRLELLFVVWPFKLARVRNFPYFLSLLRQEFPTF